MFIIRRKFTAGAKLCVALFFCCIAVLRRVENPNIFISIVPNSGFGGPNRFLNHFINSTIFNQRQFNVSFWSPFSSELCFVFSHAWGSSFFSIARWLNIPTVLRVDGFFVQDYYVSNFRAGLNVDQRFTNHLMKMSISKADYVIYQSSFSKEMCDAHLVARKGSYAIINNGVDVKHFTPDHSLKTQQPKRVLILAKHFEFQVRYAIEIFAELHRSDPDFEMIIAGPMRDNSGSLQTIIAKNYHHDFPLAKLRSVEEVKYEDLPGIYNQADIFLHLKVGDWCPNAAIEALSCGLPIVTPEFGGTAEIVGNAGVIVKCSSWKLDDEDFANMAQAIIAVSDNFEQYTKLARERAVSKFDINMSAEKYLNVIDGLVSNEQ